MKPQAYLLMALLAAGVACGGPYSSGTACTAEYIPGVVATVTRSDTGKPVSGATLTLTEGQFTEQMSEPPGLPGYYNGAFERPGRYTLVVGAAGFSGKRIDPIVVLHDG